jgi:phosphatidylglycerol:prolipoprotein diacylglycerol transferase
MIFLRVNKMPALKTGDIIAPYIALGQAIGRIGCFLNGCCYGKYKAIPAQLTESAAMFIIFLILRKRSSSNGRTFLLYLILYSAFRFLNEFLRGDNPAFLAGMTVSQVISLAVLASAAISWKIIPSK